MEQDADVQSSFSLSRLTGQNLVSLTTRLREGSLALLDYLEQLEAAFETWEPEIQAFVAEEGRFARLRQEAQHLLDQYPEPVMRPPLFGVPLAVKDIFHAKGFETFAGSALPAGELRGREAAVVTALKQAGTLVLGKSVTTEFAYFAPGPTRNPHNLAHTPGGSSSGSAAAVAAGFCPLALGTQTIGSINRPAAFCGVVGYKPSYDRIARDGVIPLAPSLDHVGFFTAHVPGAGLVAGLLASQWQVDIIARKPVLGIPQGPYMERASAAGLLHFRDTCQRLGEAGYTIKMVPALPDFPEIEVRLNQLLAAEAYDTHARWLAAHEDRYHEKTRALLDKGKTVPAQAVGGARRGQEVLRLQLLQLMDEHGLDLWITPAAPGPAPVGLESTGDPIMNLPWTYSGLPTLSVPAGRDDEGLPLGIQLVGRWYGDEVLLQWAEHVERVLQERS